MIIVIKFTLVNCKALEWRLVVYNRAQPCSLHIHFQIAARKLQIGYDVCFRKQYRKMFAQQKNKKRVDFATPAPSSSLHSILDILEQAFQQHDIRFDKEYIPTQKHIDDPSSNDSPSMKSCKSIRKETDCHLSSLQQLLIKELGNSLRDILDEVFDDELEESSRQHGITCLNILRGLLSIDSITPQNRNKVLKWVFDIANINGMELSMELCNMLASIRKRLIRLGFTLLRDIQNGKGVDGGSEEEFKAAVSRLIKAKEEEISELKFQLCRVCETYVPLTSIAAHINQCEKLHQIEYLEAKLESKGSALLAALTELDFQSEDRFNLRAFFDRVFTTIGDVFVTFGLKNQLKEIRKVIDQYKGIYKTEIYTEIIELLESYSACLDREADYGDNLSDKDSKMKTKKRIRAKSIGSNTSLIPSFQTVEQEEVASESSMGQEIASEKTINTDTEAVIRLNSVKLSDFQVLESIGKGSYSQVYLVRKKNTQDLFAMKVIEVGGFDQERMRAFKQEQRIYKSITGGFNVKLYYSFSLNNLYFLILDYGCGGSLRQLLQKECYLEEQHAKLYIANLIMAVISIHRMGIVHRDLKPDNIVINELGQLILTDFNLSKLIKDRESGKEHTFFGTPDYIAPEVLRGEPTNELIDYFSVGVIAYEMVIGVTPFTADSPQEVFDNILKGEIEWPEVGEQDGQITPECKSLLEGLLHPDPRKRLGANDIEQLQSHPFFSGVNWSNLSQCEYYFVPPTVPELQENLSLLIYIQSKMRQESEKAIEGEVIVRYDILKSITNKNVKSHRNSRFKLEKELEALKTLPSAQSVRIKKHNSYNNFINPTEDAPGISCKDFYDLPPPPPSPIASSKAIE